MSAPTETSIEDVRRRLTRRFRILAALVVGLTVLVNAVPVAANHLRVRSSDIVDGAVTTPKLRDGAVREIKIFNGAVSRAKIRNGAVGEIKIHDGAVSRAKIRNGAVNGSKIQNGSIGRNKLGGQAVTARAHAKVSSNGAVAATESRNLESSQVSPFGSGLFCIHSLPFEPSNVVAASENHHINVAVSTGHGGFACPSDTQLTVAMYNTSTDQLESSNFRIVIF